MFFVSFVFPVDTGRNNVANATKMIAAPAAETVAAVENCRSCLAFIAAKPASPMGTFNKA